MREITLAAGDLAAIFVPRLSLVGSSLKHRGDELPGARGGSTRGRSADRRWGFRCCTRIPVAFGYHPYLRPPGVARSAWEIESKVSEQPILDRSSAPTGEVRSERVASGALGDRIPDHGYQSATAAWLRLRAGSRTIDLRPASTSTAERKAI